MNLRIYRYLVIILFAIILILGCSTDPKKPDQNTLGNYDYLKENIGRLIKKEMKKNQVVGVSVAIVDDQRIVWAQG